MRLESGVVRGFRLPLRAPLATARGPISFRDGVLLRLRDRDGLEGLGEASPLPGFHREDAAASARELAGWAADASKCGIVGLDDLWAHARECLAGFPAALGAADCALHDLAAQRHGAVLADWLRSAGAPSRSPVAVNALVSGLAPADVERAARAAVRRGYRTLKLKVAGRPWEEDAERVAALRRGGGTAALRVDANGGWSEREAERALDALRDVGVELAEQPVAADQLDAMARLRRRGAVAIAADEAAVGEREIARIVEAGAADVIVLKPAACGGPGVAMALASAVRRAGLELVVTAFVDSVVGRTAALHVASALPRPLAACGLATGSLLARDLGSGPGPVDGEMHPDPVPGLGVSLTALTEVGGGSQAGPLAEAPACS